MWRKNDYSKAHFHHVYARIKKNLFCNNEKGTRIACQTVFKEKITQFYIEYSIYYL